MIFHLFFNKPITFKKKYILEIEITNTLILLSDNYNVRGFNVEL